MDRQPRAMEIIPLCTCTASGQDGDGPSRDRRLLELLETAVTEPCQVGA
jgi:hypothetical protein